MEVVEDKELLDEKMVFDEAVDNMLQTNGCYSPLLLRTLRDAPVGCFSFEWSTSYFGRCLLLLSFSFGDCLLQKQMSLEQFAVNAQTESKCP